MGLLPDTAVFEFEDGEVTMRFGGIPTSLFLDLNDFLFDADKFATEDGFRRLAGLVDEYRVSWTYDATSAMDRPWQWNHALLRAWLREVGRVPVPLPSRRGEPDSSSDPS